MVRKARVEGGAAAPTGGDVDAILAGVEAFKAKHPDLWEQIRLGPCQHGIEQIAEVLKD